MPNGEQSDIDMAKLLVSHLGIEHYIINIGSAFDGLTEQIRHAGIQMTITMSFTLIAGIGMILIGAILYSRFSVRSRDIMTENAGQFLTQTKRSVEDYLRSMRRISDTLYYFDIKNKDLEEDSLDFEFNLLYEAYKDDLVSIALYTGGGDLVNAFPVSAQKEGLDVTQQSWFTKARDTMENVHFSLPHVQNLFYEPVGKHNWVISMSRFVELNRRGIPRQGVLLVDMSFSGIRQILEKANSDNRSEYIYLCSGDGDIIYHPRMELINADLYQEQTDTAGRADGTYSDYHSGRQQITIIKTVSYTGWKLVSVIPLENYSIGMGKTQYFVVLVLAFALLGILLVNQMVSGNVIRPLLKLDESVRDLENGNLNPDIYIGGPQEVEHLGRTLQTSVHKINQLMDDVLTEQEEKRRSELNALQSQINPHFLYNTLDSVVWMIEGGHNKGAVYMIRQLASLMRISISRGRTIIPIKNEIRHAESYMNIQQVRYKNTFTVSYEIPEEIKDLCTVKLILQPILENAIYYGVQSMDGDGEILVRGSRDGDDVYLDVIDNGLGMPEEQVERLLKGTSLQEEENAVRHGNGVGLYNVHTRIQLRFGQEYGLLIQSEPDEGTMVRIHLPAIRYSPDIEQVLDGKNGSAQRKSAGGAAQDPGMGGAAQETGTAGAAQEEKQ